ncbi:hypothetical protein HRG_014245 [Hirsutella rhossiliensis]
MLKQLTGCQTVISETLLLRDASWNDNDGPAAMEAYEPETRLPQLIGFNLTSGGVGPASKVHLDYSPKGARAHIRNFHPNTTNAAADIIAHEDLLYSERHKWYWIENQTADEILVVQFFDSDAEGESYSARGVLHSNAELAGTENEKDRESLEIRCLCIW